MYPADLKYTKDHEWIRIEDGQGKVGITDYAQKQLGDVVFVELAGGRHDGHAGTGVRHDRVGQGRLGAVRAGLRRGRRGQRRAQGRARAGQQRSARRVDGVDPVEPARTRPTALLDSTQYGEVAS